MNKKYPVLFQLLVSALVLFTLIIDVSATAKRSYSRGVKYSKTIYEQQATLNPYQVQTLLNGIKIAMVDKYWVDLTTRMVNPEQRSFMMKALGLGRLTEIDWQNCLVEHRAILGGNIHLSNYLELNRWLNGVYQSDNMRKIIKDYFETQLLICTLGLVAHFGSKLKDLRHNISNFDRFVEILNNSFPRNKPIEMLTTDHKVNGIIQFVNMLYPLVRLDRTKQGNGNLINEYHFRFKDDCAIYFLVPLGTLMMTFEQIDRKDASLKRKYSEIIRAYDLCQLLTRLSPDEEVVLENRFNLGSVSDIYTAYLDHD